MFGNMFEEENDGGSSPVITHHQSFEIEKRQPSNFVGLLNQ